MPEDTPYRVHSVSVVVTAEFHNPSILNRDFLVSNGIVPKDWEVVEAITTPPVSIVRYSNGIQWNVDQSRLTVDENCGAPFQNEYLVHGWSLRIWKHSPMSPIEASAELRGVHQAGRSGTMAIPKIP